MTEPLFSPARIAKDIQKLDEFAQDVLMLKYYCGCGMELIRESLDKSDIEIQSALEYAVKTLAMLLTEEYPDLTADMEKMIWTNPKKFLQEPLELLQKSDAEELESLPEPPREFMAGGRERVMRAAVSKRLFKNFMRDEEGLLKLKNALEKVHKEERRKISFKKCLKVIALAVLLSAGITMCSVEGVRVKFMNFVMDVQEKGTGLIFDTDAEYVSEEIDISYIPEGFELEEKNTKEGYLYLKFKKNGLYFSVQMLEEHENVYIDTEDAEVGKTTVNGYDAVYSYKDEVGTIAFHDENYAYTVFGNIPKERLIDIAGGIHYKG